MSQENSIKIKTGIVARKKKTKKDIKNFVQKIRRGIIKKTVVIRKNLEQKQPKLRLMYLYIGGYCTILRITYV